MIPLAYFMFSYWHTELVWVFVYAAGHIGQVTYLTVASWQQVELVTFISERCLIGLSFLVCVQVKFSPAGFPWILYLYFGTWRWNSICSISQVRYFLLLCVCHVLWLFCHVYELNTLFIDIRDSCPCLIYRVCLVSCFLFQPLVCWPIWQVVMYAPTMEWKLHCSLIFQCRWSGD